MPGVARLRLAELNVLSLKSLRLLSSEASFCVVDLPMAKAWRGYTAKSAIFIRVWEVTPESEQVRRGCNRCRHASVECWRVAKPKSVMFGEDFSGRAEDRSRAGLARRSKGTDVMVEGRSPELCQSSFGQRRGCR